MNGTTHQVKPRAERRLIPKPAALARWEARLGARIPFSANTLSLAKLVVVTPLLFLALKQVDVLPAGATLVIALLGVFFALDYLDGVVARENGGEEWFGRVLDRVTDYPLLVVVSYFCIDAVPLPLLAAKLGLDLLVLLLFLRGDGATENRLRTAMSYSMVLALLCLSQGWAPRIIATNSVSVLLIINTAFTALVALRNLDVLQKRFVADFLSAINLACGATSIAFAAQGRAEMSLLLLLIGALFDGMDGLAARRWGGTRVGVYADDIADGVNFGIAPAAVVYFTLGGVEGAVLGGLFAGFTLTRLVFFTLNKDTADPDYFSGVPSTVGGIIVLCAAILFSTQPALVGLLVGIACMQMVAFDTSYRHVGRALAQRRPRLRTALPSLLLLLAGAALWGVRAPVAALLLGNLGYGLFPGVRQLVRAASKSSKQQHIDDHNPEKERQHPHFVP